MAQAVGIDSGTADSVTPGEISALVLRKLAEDASKSLAENVTEAVTTVRLDPGGADPDGSGQREGTTCPRSPAARPARPPERF
jgi:hypothetical protein